MLITGHTDDFSRPNFQPATPATLFSCITCILASIDFSSSNHICLVAFPTVYEATYCPSHHSTMQPVRHCLTGQLLPAYQQPCLLCFHLLLSIFLYKMEYLLLHVPYQQAVLYPQLPPLQMEVKLQNRHLFLHSVHHIHYNNIINES